jgi:hypothetical protein
MLGIRSLVGGLGVFERNRVPLELKTLSLAFYIQLLGGLLGLYQRLIRFLRLLFGSGLGNLARRLMLSHLGWLGG